jgi:hypothetical protein
MMRPDDTFPGAPVEEFLEALDRALDPVADAVAAAEAKKPWGRPCAGPVLDFDLVPE